ncbi:GntR family transcriptional regulator [Achromobacter denitrificans]|uniref:GntR family transcriptional regulator n=1 Tax=Achromobacter denitrificans TaxID=32002 RepID=UPI0012D169B5|nr:GntR family transcriptional regulator [Achromobacter denitrificans]MBV2160433.1 GntR family transcriptional regulator [Achromobacter denitrificans]MDX3880850.1 GntR family transcriptional regulator [Achromobacter sp.]MPT27842.1 GntR family transcriptional regulator [Achromobacter sp.]WFC69946.1 GntR family transcriptional regulator [Achromobacter denitrificans]
MAPATHDALPVLDRSGDTPLHAQVAALLRGYIRGNKLAAGAALPSEAALCERFGVARSVVRQALGALAAEGLIQRENGRPATVAAPQEHRRLVQRSTGLYEQFAQSGVALQTRVLAFARAEPPAEVAEFFGSTRLLMLERLRHVADAPLAYVRTWLPADAVPGLRAEDLADASLHGVLTRRFGLRPGAGRNQIRAVAADAALADLLDAPAGTPLLMLQGRGMDQHGRPLEWFTTWHRAEQLVFDVDVSVGHESVQPRLQTPPAQPDAAPDAPDTAATFDGHDPLARAQALVAELSAELARLRGQR